ncbi:GntR family transcriptional regulator [Bifidobacterium moukalabense]|uniref:GntR family transcriptional regulator n=1 Tax=Bifidobacterium moukalabense TaxID=1333651 RepID=UPI0010F911C9|nr:GntR family transcriptional regulator [Bifidobacterium moukalabense]
MKLTISSTSGEPIYEQIKNQIRSAILSGELTAGEALPSLRTLAKELHVSMLTITRAYNELGDEGLVENMQGKGTFVMAHGNELIKERARERIMQVLRQTVTAAKAADIELIDLLGMFEQAYREQS